MPLTALRAALAVPPGPRHSWQRVVAGLRVAVPPMRGTAGGGRPQGTPAPANYPLAGTTLAAGRAPVRHRAASAAVGRATAPARRSGALRWAGADGGALLVLAGVLVLWRSRRRHAPGR